MGARYDKYDGVTGGFRAILAADLTFSAAGEFGPKGVSLDATGKVVVGTAGASGFVGMLVKNVPLYPNLGSVVGQVATGIPVGGRAGEAVDIMTDGEILDIPGLAAGTKYYVDAAGALNTTNTNPFVGWTVEQQGNGLFRMVVRVQGK